MSEPRAVRPDIFEPYAVDAFFGMAALSEDEARKLLSPDTALYLPMQKHTDLVIVVNESSEPETADAAISDTNQVAVGVKTADCVPLLLYDKGQHIVAAIHAGWRGTAQSIVPKTIQTMKARFGTRPYDIVLAIGPSIRSCCYEVGTDVAYAVAESTGAGDYITVTLQNPRLDLQEANRLQAIASGVAAAHIWVSQDCTCCTGGGFHSFRRDQAAAGRQYAVIALR